MMDDFDKEAVERIRGIVDRDEHFRHEGTQASTIRPLFKIIDRLEAKLQNNNLGFYFICSHCGAQAWTEYDSIDSGSLLTCCNCKEQTAICLYRPEVYSKRTTFEAKSKKIEAQLQALKKTVEPFVVFYELTLSKLPTDDGLICKVGGIELKASAFCALAAELNKIKEAENSQAPAMRELLDEWMDECGCLVVDTALYEDTKAPLEKEKVGDG
jgi:hypothetical protein